VTNTKGNTVAAGWYDDPAGSGQKRWWDGGRWTEHLHDPSLEVYGAVATPVVGVGTPVYNAYIWLIVLLPLLSTASLAFFDMNGYLRDSMAAGASGSGVSGSMALFTPAYVLLMVGGWGLYLVAVLLAYFDWRKLGRDGYARPFHWAWAFLSGTVYIIGRSVVVRRRSGHGLLPIWILIAVFVASFVVGIVKVVDAFFAVFSTIQFS
jgi:hypothetical protein